ncbi:DUF1285 domain-containing protein [Acetobacter fallax]|uniref:DUF1285 domain-containing protein n=1 Tax=Acetobacter fallax TaxID=1737473 RepID=UPI00156AD016
MTRDSFPEECGSGLSGEVQAEGVKRSPHQCGKLPFLIRRDGAWLYKGSLIRRKPMVCLFASALRRAADGVFWLRTPVEEGTIDVEDAPFVAIEMDWRGSGRQQVLCFRTNVDAVVVAGPDHPLRARWDVPFDACDNASPPYLTVRAGDGEFPVEARVSRSVWYELAALAEPGCCRGEPCLGVWSSGVFFPLARAPCDRKDEDHSDGEDVFL